MWDYSKLLLEMPAARPRALAFGPRTLLGGGAARAGKKREEPAHDTAHDPLRQSAVQHSVHPS